MELFYLFRFSLTPSVQSCGLGAVPQVEGGHCMEGGGSALEQGHSSQGSRAEFITTGIPLLLGRQNVVGQTGLVCVMVKGGFQVLIFKIA